MQQQHSRMHDHTCKCLNRFVIIIIIIVIVNHTHASVTLVTAVYFASCTVNARLDRQRLPSEDTHILISQAGSGEDH
jgi:hypothetical protein